jgi:hypothetical protein
MQSRTQPAVGLHKAGFSCDITAVFSDQSTGKSEILSFLRFDILSQRGKRVIGGMWSLLLGGLNTSVGRVLVKTILEANACYPGFILASMAPRDRSGASVVPIRDSGGSHWRSRRFPFITS